MKGRKLSELTDQELLDEAKKNEIKFHNSCFINWNYDRSYNL